MKEKLTIKIRQDIPLFARIGESPGMYRKGVIANGQTVETGDSDSIFMGFYDHKVADFVPLRTQFEDVEETLYIKTVDLPDDW